MHLEPVRGSIPRWRGTGGFTLYEIVLSMIVFSIVMVALVGQIGSTVDVGNQLNRDRHIRRHLEALLNEALQEEDVSAMSREQIDEQMGVDFAVTVEELGIANYEGEALEDLYKVRATATWDEGGETIVIPAELTVYRP